VSSDEETFDALMAAIKSASDRVTAAAMHEGPRAAALRDLAAAWRHLQGGEQPTTVHVESK